MTVSGGAEGTEPIPDDAELDNDLADCPVADADDDGAVAPAEGTGEPTTPEAAGAEHPDEEAADAANPDGVEPPGTAEDDDPDEVAAGALIDPDEPVGETLDESTDEGVH